MAKIFDGREFSSRKKAELSVKVEDLKKRGITPCLASIFLVSDKGSSLYTKLKSQEADSIGVKFILEAVEEKDSETTVQLVKKLNEDPSVHGILVQKPSGENDYSEEDWFNIVSSINPKKDVDGLTPNSLGNLTLGRPTFIPATVKAVLSVIAESRTDLESRNVVILGASEILGKPLSMILTDRGATVSMLHSKSKDIQYYLDKADILISATGSPGIVNSEMVKSGSVVIDVGSPKGDILVDKNLLNKVSFLSAVPGGVGPVTVISLLENLIDGFK